MSVPASLSAASERALNKCKTKLDRRTHQESEQKLKRLPTYQAVIIVTDTYIPLTISYSNHCFPINLSQILPNAFP